MAKALFTTPLFQRIVANMSFLNLIILIFVISVAIAVIAEVAIKKIGFGGESGSIAIELEITIYITLLSTIIAFLAVIEWNSSDRVYTNVVEEASYLRAILNRSRRFTPKDSGLRETILSYVNSIIDFEYVHLGKYGSSSPETIKAYRVLIDEINTIVPTNSIESEYLAQIIDDAGQLGLRRNRIVQFAIEDVPKEIWYILIPASFISVASVFITQSNPYVRVFASSVYSVLTFGVLAFVIYIQYPFTGNISVSDRPFVLLRDDMNAGNV